MIWWIVLGVCVFAVLILVLAALPLLRRLRELARVQLGLQRRVLEAQRALEPALAALQQRTVELEATLRTTEERAAVLQARRGEP
jgi:hypothetical protein